MDHETALPIQTREPARMRNELLLICFLGAALLLPGCATSQRQGHDSQREAPSARPALTLAPDLEEKILALDPARVTQTELREVLAQAPAPRIINIHGGIYPVHLAMKSFAKFLVGMGYPEASLKRSGNGAYSFTCYERSENMAGAIAWYYEREGLRPMMVGHSQGGIQAVKVLDQLAGRSSAPLAVWNPLTRKSEQRYDIIDPLTGEARSAASVQLCYASAVGAGGFTRFLPNQWDMLGRLRKIPDSVEEFTGFYMGLDIIGGDFGGFGSANKYEPLDKAIVRNVRLPTGYSHVTVPATEHLLKDPQIIDWINRYTPTEKPRLDVKFDSDSSHILWAADVWHSVKKHWVLELQRLIRAKRALPHAE